MAKNQLGWVNLPHFTILTPPVTAKRVVPLNIYAYFREKTNQGQTFCEIRLPRHTITWRSYLGEGRKMLVAYVRLGRSGWARKLGTLIVLYSIAASRRNKR